MPYLADFIGHLLSEITLARMQADFEAVRVAELYAAHPLLRYMPVPHFRVPNIDLDAPVVMQAMEVSSIGPATQEDIRAAFDGVLQTQLAADEIKLDSGVTEALDKALIKNMGLLSWPSEGPVDVISVARDLSGAAMAALTQPVGPIDPQDASSFEERLRTTAAFAMVKLLQPLGRLKVAVTTAEIKEASTGSDVVARFHLKLTEEGLEWSVSEVGGVQQQKLILE